MENIGDWIYVIILIIAGISSILSAFRKKSQEISTQTQQDRQPQQAQQQQAQPPREIIKGDVFDDDFWGDQTKKLPEKPVPSVKTQPKAKQTSQVDYRIFQINEGQSSLPKEDNPIFADNQVESALITLEDLPSETEEWRKALIYNEILNRKY